jgi:endonuclease YncB( thermonuclease family)
MGRPPLGICVPVKVVGVHDGDTLTVQVGDAAHQGLFTWPVRLKDCWAPETNKPLEKARGIQAREYLKKVLAGAKDCALFVSFEDLGPEQNPLARITTLSRLVGKLYVNDQDVGEQMVRAGLAYRSKEELVAAIYDH